MEDNQEPIVSMDEFKSAFGITTTATEPTVPAEPVTPTTPETTPPETQGTEGAQPTEPTVPTEGGQPAEPTVDKAAQTAETFARMRVTASKYEKILMGVANTLGLKDINMKDPDAVAEALQAKVTEATAKNQNVPAEFLKKLDDLEEYKQAQESKEIKTAAFIGFENVKQQFKLDNKGLEDFANELIANGTNPFLERIDLVKEYKVRHFDELMQKAKDEAALTEAQRAAKAQTNGSIPGNKQGASTSTEQSKINSVKELNSWFEKNGQGK